MRTGTTPIMFERDGQKYELAIFWRSPVFGAPLSSTATPDDLRAAGWVPESELAKAVGVIRAMDDQDSWIGDNCGAKEYRTDDRVAP